ncbi:Low-density lipoprotein receptor domain class A [Cooperia oncophora]
MTQSIILHSLTIIVLVESLGQSAVPFRNSKEDYWDMMIAPEFARIQQSAFEKIRSAFQKSELPRSTTYSPTTDGTYVINYCDRFEFTDEMLTRYGLARVEHFIYNTSCSSTFFQNNQGSGSDVIPFQCSIGQTFPLRCSSEDQAFDQSTTNCNFKNAVKACPEYDHVMHCSQYEFEELITASNHISSAVRESCSESEFACCSLPQRCLPRSMRCDGHADCADGDDENNCRYSDRCIPAEKRCDGIADDCGDGSNLDEIGCNRNTSLCSDHYVTNSNNQ